MSVLSLSFMTSSLTFAANTQRAIGWVLAVLVLAAFVIYLVLNIRSGRPEVGSEIELAPNRKPYYDDDILETKRLDRSLIQALGFLGIVAVALPVYWLREPGRMENAEIGQVRTFTSRGSELYEAQCSRCHGPGATGGVAARTLTDESGGFVATVNWTAPALTSVLTRFDEDEVRYILNYGRNGVMPAWGAPGGGPLTEQQLTTLVYYMRSIQLTPEEVQAEVIAGVVAGLGEDNPVLAEQPVAGALLAFDEAVAVVGAAGDDETARADALTTLAEAQAAVDAAFTEALGAEGYGELLFNNEGSAGQFNCARCHTAGFSYGATSDTGVADLIQEWPNLETAGTLTTYEPGVGFFGPNLTNGSTTRQFPTAEEHATFIEGGSQIGTRYGQGGQGNGRMPGFGLRDDADLGRSFSAILTAEQIAAIVAYERGL